MAAQGAVVKEAKAAAAANKEDKEAAKKSKVEVAELLKLKEQPGLGLTLSEAALRKFGEKIL